MEIDEEDEVIDIQEQMFHNSVREQIVSDVVSLRRVCGKELGQSLGFLVADFSPALYDAVHWKLCTDWAL